MSLEELARAVHAMQVEQIMDAAIIGVLLKTHPNPRLLHKAWQETGFDAEELQGDDLSTVRARYDHWMEMIVAAMAG